MSVTVVWSDNIKQRFPDATNWQWGQDTLQICRDYEVLAELNVYKIFSVYKTDVAIEDLDVKSCD